MFLISTFRKLKKKKVLSESTPNFLDIYWPYTGQSYMWLCGQGKFYQKKKEEWAGKRKRGEDLGW